MKELSIVTTMYKSSVFLDDFVEQCRKAVSSLSISDYEIVLVNDGSPDNSLQTALDIKKTYPEIVVVNLSRNFGHHPASLAGLSVAQGSWVFTIDCDLEVSPLVLCDFWKQHLDNATVDRFYGVQDTRKGGFVEKMGGQWFYTLYNKFSETAIPRNILTESLMSHQVVEEVIKMGDINLFLAGMFSWVGFEQVPIVCHKIQRKTKSTYTLQKRIALSLQAITSFSAYPLRILFHIGVIITTISFVSGLYLIIKKLIMPEYILSGFTSMIVVLLFSLGIIVLSIGILGIYIERLFSQTKGRQRFIIRKVYK